MSHKSIRLLIENTAKSLQDDIKYSYGVKSDFNQDKKKAFTYASTSLLSAVPGYRVNNVQNFMKQWNIEIAFFKLDKEDSGPDKYQVILDETNNLCDRFLNNLNKDSGIVIQSVRQDPALKVTADILTGHILTVQILANDDFDYCEDCP